MQVTSGSDWLLPSGNRRMYSVAFDSIDGEQMIASWATLSIKDRLKELQKRADVAVLQYMREQDAITEEFYSGRVAKIMAG